MMDAPLTLYTNPMSRGRIARWMLEEVGRPYDVNYVSYGDEMQGPEYRALNPMAKVPTLRHGDALVTECAAIVTYLADSFPQARLAPAAGSAGRGPYLRWMFFAAGPLEYAVTYRALGLDHPPEKSGMVGFGNFERVIDTLDGALSRHDFLTGEAFTAADLYLGAQIAFGLRFETVPARPAFTAYAERITARPAYRRAAELDNAAMPKED